MANWIYSYENKLSNTATWKIPNFLFSDNLKSLKHKVIELQTFLN